MFSSGKLVESPCNAILGIAQKFILSRVLMIFAELRLGQLLDSGPAKLSDMASTLKVHPNALRRFLRLLTAHHIIINLGDDVFGSTPISKYLDNILNKNLIDDYNGLDQALDALKNDEMPLSHVFAQSLHNYLKTYLTQTNPSSNHDLLTIAHEFILAKIVMSSAELKLGNLLENGPLSLEEIASKVKLSQPTVKLFMQILTTHDIVKEISPDIFSSTELSKCFDRILSPHILDGYKVFNGALHTLKTNTGSWEHVFGKSFYEFLNQDIEKLQMFREWCVQSAMDWLPPILSLCNFPAAKTIIDVGGGGGHFIASVLRQNPHMQGILFDQPSVIEGADKSLIFEGIRNKVNFVGGDFFKSIPKNGDIYTICRTLLNWDDNKCIEIINNCHAAMENKGKLWIIDFLVPDKSHPKYPRAVINDISLFVIFNSAIRTEKEWRNLIERTLFTVSNIFVTTEEIKPEPYYPMCVIEVAPKIQISERSSASNDTDNEFRIKL